MTALTATFQQDTLRRADDTRDFSAHFLNINFENRQSRSSWSDIKRRRILARFIHFSCLQPFPQQFDYGWTGRSPKSHHRQCNRASSGIA